MNIKRASEITGLTKKAIKYYEEAGLIILKKNRENGYREYDATHIERLNLISALRALGISINEIDKCLEDKNMLNVTLNKKLNNIEEDIELLKNTKVIIREIIDENLEINESSKNILRLKELLQFSKEQKGVLIKDKLMQIFPGTFGRLIVINYLPFLNITLDSEEKKKAFLDLINYLDDVEEFHISSELEKQLELMDGKEEFYNESLKHREKMIEDVISGQGEHFEKLKQTITDTKKLFYENEEYRNLYLENKKKNKNLTEALKEKGYYDNVVNKLKIINPKYEEYCSKLEKLNDAMGLVYDEDGVPKFK
jgi:DNA-binding transcriptional MerR regulator